MAKKTSNKLSIEEGLEFIENMRLLQSRIEGQKKPISIRIPERLLVALKTKAKLEDRKYQHLIITAIREFLSKDLD